MSVKRSDSVSTFDKTEDNTDSFQQWRQKRRSSVRKDSQELALSNSGPPPLLRRRSTLRSITQSISGILGLRRLTLIKNKQDDFKLKEGLENTYKMSPDRGTVFNCSKIRQITEEILEQELSNQKYNHVTCGALTCDLAVKIKAAVKDLGFPRYKIVCQIVVGQVQDQGLEAASRSVWDSKTDNYACVSYKNDSIFAIALIHGIYYE